MGEESIPLRCVCDEPSQQPYSMTTDIEIGPTSNGTLPRKKRWDILDLVGGDGPWQRRIFLVILFLSIPAAMHNLAMTFLAPNIDHWCARPPYAHNMSLEEWRSVGLPQDDQKCSRYEDINISSEDINLTYPVKSNESVVDSYKIVPCDSWEYDATFYTSTVLSQWDLVCDREWLVSMSKSIYMIGILTAAVVFGYISDRIGRRPAIAASACIAVFAAIICTFSTSFYMFIITRYFLAVGMSGCFTTCFVLLMETVGPELRPIYGLAVQFGWCLGFVSLPAISWLLRDWFWIQMVLTGPCILMLATWWMVPESPRWLLSHGKVEEAQKVLNRAAEVNGVKISDIDSTLKKVMTKASEIHEAGECRGNIFTLLRTPGLWQITLNMCFIWFVNAFVYYGLTYNTNELVGDPFINFAVSGAVEFPAYFLSIFAIRSLGRRNPLAGTMVIGGIACLLSYPLPQNPWWLTVSVSMVGKFCITCSFGIIYVYTTELFPTVVRSIALGSASLFARFGSIIAPFVRELGNATHPVIPQIVFGILATLSGVLVLLLPETNNCSIPDTLKEAADASSRISKKPKLEMSGSHVTVTLSNGHNDFSQDDTSQTIFAPSPKPQANGKKLADVPEEDSHCDDTEEDCVMVTADTHQLITDTLPQTSEATNEVIVETEKEVATTCEDSNHAEVTEQTSADKEELLPSNDKEMETIGNTSDSTEQQSEL